MSIKYVLLSFYKLDSWLLCNVRGDIPVGKKILHPFLFIRALELTLHGQPRSNVMVQLD